MKISFRQLTHALALARHRNFRLAAAELHISQPALTRSIMALEGLLGARLFDRLSSGVELTAAGEIVLQRGHRVLQESEDMERALADLLGMVRGRLVISTGPYPGDSLVPDAVAALMRRAPDIHCHIREVDWTGVARHLLDRESDLGVADISEVEGDERFATELLITDPFYFVCRSRHPLASKSRVELADFGRYALVGNRTPERVARFLAAGVTGPGDPGPAGPFRAKIDVETFAATRRILLASDGISMAPLAQVAAQLRDGSMTLLRTDIETPRMHSGLIYHRGRSFSPAAALFADELRRIKGDLDRQTADLSARYGLG
ncbi:MAG: LysR family transcriptional regulator [Gammaproteobacteria bacterium]|nr:LysR family transcriptional regulator [Gammaproteobacteria bacterium]MDH5170891.1 LysR family transcriptional regulator [Gammaproteobacteria bacterium]